jgi:PTS system trehalose-specific IIC component
MLIFAFAMLIAIVIPFVLTFIIGKKKLNPATGEVFDSRSRRKERRNSLYSSRNEEDTCSPAAGKIIPITAVNDQAFASKSMGDGLQLNQPMEQSMHHIPAK